MEKYFLTLKIQLSKLQNFLFLKSRAAPGAPLNIADPTIFITGTIQEEEQHRVESNFTLEQQVRMRSFDEMDELYELFEKGKQEGRSFDEVHEMYLGTSSFDEMDKMYEICE